MIVYSKPDPPPTKRLLFLDDKVERWEALSSKLPSNIGFTCWVQSAAAAITALNEDLSFDIVCLDHDLGDEHCGCVVVDWIIAHKKFFTNTTFIIHSWNPDGAEVMQMALVNAGLKSRRKVFHIEHIPL